MPGGFFSGLLAGFSGSARAGREQAAREAELQLARESKVMEHLATSDDPEIAGAALSGLLESASGMKRPKGGFLSNLLGAPRPIVNPAMAKLLSMINTPVDGGPGLTVTTGATPTFDTPDGGGGATTGASAAMPTTVLGEDAPPLPPNASGVPTLPNVSRGPLRMTGGTAVETPGPPPRPRQVFLPADEKMRRTTIARETAEVEGEYQGLIAAGFTPEQAREELKKKRTTGTAAPYQSVMLEVPDGQGGWTPVAGSFNRTTNTYTDTDGTPLPNARPRQTTGSTSMGALRESIARARYGKPYAQLTAPEQTQVLAAETQTLNERAGGTTTARNDANAVAPLDTQQRFQAITTLTNEFTKLDANAKVRREQLRLMETALGRFDQDPVGAVEGIRVTFEKILDPESVVREAEYARQTNGLSFGEKLQGLWQKYVSGGGDIPKPVLAEMVETARAFEKNMDGANALELDRIRRRAEAFGLDPSLVLPGVAAAPMTRPQGPAPVGAPPPNRVATPPPGRPSGGGTTMNEPPAPPTAPALVDQAQYPWYAADLDTFVRSASPQAGQPFAVIEYTEPSGVKHELRKYPDGRVVVIR